MGLLAESVAAHPDRAAVVDERGTTSWRELDERAERLVHALRDRGLSSGDRVVSLLGNQVEAVEVALACAQGGWIQVPLNWHGVADEVAYVLADAEAVAFVVDGRFAPAAEGALAQAPVPSLRARLVAHGEAEGFEPYEDVLAASRAGEIADAERGGPMFYTSGTTGHPKGVRSALASVGGPPEVLTLIAHSMKPVMDLPDDGAVQLVCGPIYHSA
ncbi:MAG: AMP-binding protein, partial [Actinobacteria bacterium]|nr:AMP-binding protein [Actinomycetota bacterium]